MTRRLLLSFVSITAFVLLVLEVPLGFSFASAERRRLETSVQHDALSAAIRAEEFLERGPVGKTIPTLQQLADRLFGPKSDGRKAWFLDRTGHSLSIEE